MTCVCRLVLPGSFRSENILSRARFLGVLSEARAGVWGLTCWVLLCSLPTSRRPPAVDRDPRAGLGDVGCQRVQPEGRGLPEVLHERSCALCAGQRLLPRAGPRLRWGHLVGASGDPAERYIHVCAWGEAGAVGGGSARVGRRMHPWTRGWDIHAIPCGCPVTAQRVEGMRGQVLMDVPFFFVSVLEVPILSFSKIARLRLLAE